MADEALFVAETAAAYMPYCHFYVTIVDVAELITKTRINKFYDVKVYDHNESSLYKLIDDLTESIQKKINSLLSFDKKRILIAVAPGGGRQTKRWLSLYFSELIDMLGKSFKVDFLLLGSDGDKKICDEIEKSVKNRIVNWSGKTTLLETAAALQHCQMIICNDTGLMHMAAALGRKIVAIFGPTVIEFGFFPFTKEYKVVEHEDLSCRPCSYHGTDTCPKKHFHCMKEIYPERVFQAVKNCLFGNDKLNQK